MSPPQLWLLVGGNGAGKTTFYRLFLEPRSLPFVNADRIAESLAPHEPEQASYEAAGLAERMRQQLLASGQSFCFETVFSHASKVDFAAKAKGLGYQVILVFIHVDDPTLNLARISQRVAEERGRNVPEHKVRTRLPRTLENVATTIPIADEVHLLDNSSWDAPFRRLAIIRDGETQHTEGAPPDWALNLLERAAQILRTG